MRFGLCKLLRVLSSVLTEQRYQPTQKKPQNKSNHPVENVNDRIWKKNQHPVLALETGSYLDLTSLHLVNMNLGRSPFRLFQIEAKHHFHITSPSERQIGRLRLFQRMQMVMMSLSRKFLLRPFVYSFYTVILIIRFSLSKWIHLNSGDEGLKQFFHRVLSVLNPGGFFVLEPQPWDSYAKARRMDQVSCQFVFSDR